MFAEMLAEVVLAIHFAFILFVVLGAGAVLWRQSMMWLHLPAVAWAALNSVLGWTCPLTPLENWLRARSGGFGYSGGFVSHYVGPIVYPEMMDRDFAVISAIALLVWTILVYSFIVVRWRDP